MALSNRDRLSKALDLFTESYRVWVGQQLQGKFGDDGIAQAQEFIKQAARPGAFVPQNPDEWDVQCILNIIFSMWRTYFREVLGSQENSMLHELQTIRNEWAHQKAFNTNDTLRALDTVARLLKAVSAHNAASEVEKLHGDVMRTRFAEMQRVATTRAQRQATEGTPETGLRPWREIIIPHPDVRDGNFTQAEFAADLAQVHRGGAASEYADPKEFFQRTYITDGLRGLIRNALKRLNGNGGHPVIELQTNFGGGKTHSMLALYHLVSGVPASRLSGVDVLLGEENLPEPPEGTCRAVLVGTALAPGQPEKTEDGLSLNTLWGRLAYQLGGKDAYALIEESDKNSTSPGSDDLCRLFEFVGPCLILIDEWVAFCRQTYNVYGLPGGSFDQNLSFAQALTEAVKASPKALLVASLPQSQIEVGGTGGKEALASLEDTFGRLEFNWRPANQEESYEIVRRRLFEPITDPRLFADRDAAIAAFFRIYAKNKSEFPMVASEGPYEERMKAAYPIHPELFDRLYNDWSSLEEFQRTRGVLRLMATIIHVLWARNDRSLMILPSFMPMDEDASVTELTRYLQPNWPVIISSDIDGSQAIPTRLDKDSPRFGQYWAVRRVARTVYMGSAPTEGRANKGVDIRNVRLGCVQPGENVAVFGDALRQLGDHASHLYADGSRYWFATQPNVITMARDRAARIKEVDSSDEINRLIREEADCREKFHRVHGAPESSSDVPDEPESRLVIFDASKTHSTGSDSSSAIKAAKEWLEKRGNSPRQNRNAMVFLAADKARIEDIKDAAAWYLSWKSICGEKDRLNLDPYNVKMAQDRLKESEAALKSRLPETFQWLIVPEQSDPLGAVEMNCKRITGGEGLVNRAWSKLNRDGLIDDHMAGTILRMHCDKYLWKEQNHISIKQLVDYFSQYLYLPRVSHPKVIVDAIIEGASHTAWATDSFAYADRYDEDAKRYVGLTAGTLLPRVETNGIAVLVKPGIAEAQMEAEQPKPTTPEPAPEPTGGQLPFPDPTEKPGTGGFIPEPASSGSSPTSNSKVFHGSVSLNPTKASLQFQDIVDEVLQHFTARLGTTVKITLEIEAEDSDGFDDNIKRTVKENSTTLGFSHAEFEEG